MMKNEERKRTKSTFTTQYEVRFPDSDKGQQDFASILLLDNEVLLVYILFALLLARLGVRAPISYVQDAILNLRDLYIVVATAITVLKCNHQKPPLKCKFFLLQVTYIMFSVCLLHSDTHTHTHTPHTGEQTRERGERGERGEREKKFFEETSE